MLDSMVRPIRRMWPQLRQAGHVFTQEVVPSIGSTVAKMGSEVAQVIKQEVLPSIGESLIELSNDAVPVINWGIDVASERLDHGSQVLSRATSKGMYNIGRKIMGRRRQHKLRQIIDRMSHQLNYPVTKFTHILSNMVKESHPHKPTNNRRFGPHHYSYYSPSYYDNFNNDYDLGDEIYGQDIDYTIRKFNSRHNEAKPSTLMSNLAYIVSSTIFGSNLTKIVAPIARRMTESIPTVSMTDHQILIGLPGEGPETDRQLPARSCTSPSGENGLCRFLSDCPDLLVDFANLRRSVCFMNFLVPGVCCPKSMDRCV